MDAALKRSRSEEPAELPPPARDVEEEEEGEGMEKGLEEEEEVDPRIQGELEKLNQSTDEINRRETELEAQLEAQKATQDFQRATEVLRAAKETISLAEQRLLEDDKRQFDSAWQEMLNHATQRVMEAEQTKTRSELVHKETAARYNAAMGRMRQLEKKLKRAINKSKPYFELKAKYYVQLEQLKKTVDDLQAKLALAKGEYKTALKNLEMISDEIHERRRSSAMGPRGCGVGAEGSSTSAEDLSGSKPEPDAISVASEAFEDDTCSNFVSEDDSETQSVSSFSSGPTSPCEMPDQFPAVARPGSLDLPSPMSLSEFGITFPVLGPRSECSGASSPECEVERGDRAEGAENKTSDKANNRGLGSSSSGGGGGKSQSIAATEGQALEKRMKQLSLQRSKGRDGIFANIKMVQIG
ncbi:SH3 domain-binding protein 5 isoform X2 [Elephas maximus indicus]|uniref:SH3 domain-binding protein 5 isoform X2 n=1 Tax=Elephas maximus indicus TaxID=99487 RepID=UPI002116EBA4|nr:SH3 domain-binding protein 5 isoform X2 [Elephas maximus indicus]